MLSDKQQMCNLNTHFGLNVLFIVLVSFAVIILGEPNALVYTFMFGFAILLISGADRNIFYYKNIFVYLCIAFLVIIVGLRDFGIGYDTNVYIESYFYEARRIHTINDFLNIDRDLGFVFLAYVANLFGNDAQSLLLIVEFWICIFTFAAILEVNKKNNRIEWVTFLFLWLFTFLNLSMNLMRQYCAMSMLLLAFAYLLNGKYNKAIIMQVLAYFFHSSAVVFIPVFGIFYLSKWNNKKQRNIYTIVLLLLSLVMITQIFTLLPTLASFGFISESYAYRYGADSNFTSKNIFGVSIITIYILIYYLIYASNKKCILCEEEAYIAYTIHSLFFILRLLAFYIEYLARLSEYYFYVDILLVSIMLSSNRITNLLRCLIYICFIYYWYRSYILVPSAATYPFKSSILGI